ncbi:MAG TPA: hypothetical protein VHB46_04275 [Burkholderiales bacterium]|nr:hypothetical protein [Burkholderiales bacterium]
MTDIQVAEETPSSSMVTIAQVIYALHSLSILIGLTSAVTIVGAFVFGLPSIIAVILNYVYQAGARGSFVESHFRWQIRTFWFAAAWVVAAWFLFITLIGIPLAFFVWIATGLWVIYRVARGWLTLQDRKPLPS